MKKIYISPKSRVFHLIPEKVIAGSLAGNVNNDYNGEDIELVRRRMWMEDEEDEW